MFSHIPCVNNIFFLVNATRKSGKLQVIKRQVVENCFQPCQTQRRQLPPVSTTLLLKFSMSAWWQVPCTRLSGEKERKKYMTRHRPLLKAQTCKVSETKSLFEAKHLHRTFSCRCFRELVSVLSWWCLIVLLWCCFGEVSVIGDPLVLSWSCLGFGLGIFRDCPVSVLIG